MCTAGLSLGGVGPLAVVVAQEVRQNSVKFIVS